MGRVARLPLVLVALPLLALPAGAQQTVGQQTTSQTGNHTGTTGSVAPMHSGNRQFNAGQFNPFRPNAYGTGAAPPPPSWELPRVSTPHWEIPPNIPIQPNPVQGNPISHSRAVGGVGYVGLPYFYDPLASMDAGTYDNSEQQQQPVPAARPDYAPQPNRMQQDYAPEEFPATRPPYNADAYGPPAPQPAASGNGAADDGLDHPEVTLVFNDGRPPLKVHSYVLTGTSVFVAEHGHQRVIPVSELDLAATIQQNREAGVDFVLPGGK